MIDLSLDISNLYQCISDTPLQASRHRQQRKLLVFIHWMLLPRFEPRVLWDLFFYLFLGFVCMYA